MKELIKPNEIEEIYNILQPECGDHETSGCKYFGCDCYNAHHSDIEEIDDIIF